MHVQNTNHSERYNSKILKDKVIIYTNTTKSAEDIKESIDTFLDPNSTLQEDLMMIHGNMYADINFLSAVKFTTSEMNPEDNMKNNVFLPRIFIATASCIGNGLDSKDACHVIHVG